ncbi:MAG: LCP family protein [Oscillospiraceae bacterium]|nr:LCP family protein [Oscillospiraceae bacterium]
MKLRINKRVIRITLVFIAIVILGSSLFYLLSRWEASRASISGDSEQYPDSGRQVLYYKGETYALREDLETVLFIGVDKYEADTGTDSYNNTQQADFIMLVIIDHTNKTYTALQLNRDTMTDITMLGVRGENTGVFTGQLALAHTYGSGGRDSCRNTVEAVSNYLYGIDIDHYVALTMDAIPIINDLAGGVQVEMLADFSAFDSAMSKGTVVTLHGEQALTYVRTRKGLDDSTNLSRMLRQQQYLNALSKNVQVCLEGDDTFLVNVVSETGPTSIHWTQKVELLCNT